MCNFGAEAEHVFKFRMYKDLFEWVNTNFTLCFFKFQDPESCVCFIQMHKLNYKDEEVIFIINVWDSPFTFDFQHIVHLQFDLVLVLDRIF